MLQAYLPSDTQSLHAAIRRELYSFTLYRLLEAALLCLTVFAPVAMIFGEPRHPHLAAGIAILYLIAAISLFFSGRRGEVNTQAVSYTHLDVYKRQVSHRPQPWCRNPAFAGRGSCLASR